MYGVILLHMTGYSVRFPKEATDAIDVLINKKNYFTTRPEFILFAMKSTAMIMAEKYRMMLEMIKNDNVLKNIKGQEKALTEKVGAALIDKFNDKYKGEPVQIMIRIPDGLNSIIEDFVIRIGYVTNKLDFIRMSIVCTMESLDEMEKIIQNAEKFTAEMKKAQEELLKAVSEKVIAGADTNDLINEAVKSNIRYDN